MWLSDCFFASNASTLNCWFSTDTACNLASVWSILRTMCSILYMRSMGSKRAFLGNVGAGCVPDKGSGSTPPIGLVGSAPGGDDAIGVEKATFGAFLDISGSYEAESCDYLPDIRSGACRKLKLPVDSIIVVPSVQCVSNRDQLSHSSLYSK